MNVNLFNQLLLRRECCSFSNGEHVRGGLTQVEQWIANAGAEYVGDSWDELRYIRQVKAGPLATRVKGDWATGRFVGMRRGADRAEVPGW